jgi:hypothetical protein
VICKRRIDDERREGKKNHGRGKRPQKHTTHQTALVEIETRHRLCVALELAQHRIPLFLVLCRGVGGGGQAHVRLLLLFLSILHLQARLPILDAAQVPQAHRGVLRAGNAEFLLDLQRTHAGRVAAQTAHLRARGEIPDERRRLFARRRHEGAVGLRKVERGNGTAVACQCLQRERERGQVRPELPPLPPRRCSATLAMRGCSYAP